MKLWVLESRGHGRALTVPVWATKLSQTLFLLRVDGVADLLDHADYEVLFLDFVRFNGLIILQDLAYFR